MADFLNKFLDLVTNKSGYTAARQAKNGKAITDVYLIAKDDQGNELPVKVNSEGNMLVQQVGKTLAESMKTEADEVNGTVSFSTGVKHILIYNRDATDGVFTVNNLEIPIPAGESEMFSVGGTPSASVSVSGSSSYILGRYE